MDRRLARARARAGRRGRRTDRARLPRGRVGHRDGRAGLVDPRRPRRARRARRRARLGNAERAERDERRSRASPSPSPPAAPLPSLQQATFGSALMGWLDLLAPALLGVVVVGRRKLGAAVVTGIAAGLWGLLLFVTSEVAATVPVLAGLAFAAADARRRRLRHPLEPARARGGARGDRRGGAGRALVPRRPRRLRAAAERVLRARRRAGRRLPRGQPRPRRARHDRPRRVPRRRRRSRRAGRASVLEPECAGVPRPPRAGGPAHGVALYHGSARDPVWEYVLTDEAALATLELAGVAARPRRAQPRRAAGGAVGRRARRAASRRPARSSSSAACGRSSTPARSASRATATRGPPTSCSTSTRSAASFRRVEYDVERTQREMREAGLPEMLAARLALGL